MKPDVAISDFTGIIKANSSAWIKNRFHSLSAFEWQDGFGAFSYSKSQSQRVVNYILNQQEHHRKKTFREEYIDFLNAFEIKFDYRYLFEFYD